MAKEYGSITVTNKGRSPFGFFDRNNRHVEIPAGRKASNVEVYTSVARKLVLQSMAPGSTIKVDGDFPAGLLSEADRELALRLNPDLAAPPKSEEEIEVEAQRLRDQMLAGQKNDESQEIEPAAA